MIQLSERVLALEESATIAMSAKSRAMKQKGIDVISLSLGEPDFGTPKHIQEAGKQAIDDGYSHYTPVPGYLDLREAISEKFKRDNNLTYSPEQIVTSTGAKQTLVNLMMVLVNPGDEVIIPAPFWVSYAGQVELMQGKVVQVKANIENDFKITPDQLEAAITDKTKAFVFSSPCNPTGSVYSKAELAGLAEVFAKHPNIIIISDEIYELINFIGNHESIGANESIKNQVVTVNGISKGFAMTGWRLGYMGAPLAIAKACGKMQGQFTSGTSAVTQRATIAALKADYAPSYKMRDEFLRRRNFVGELLGSIEGLKINIPEGAFYYFPDVSAFYGKANGDYTINNNNDVANYLLEKGHVATVSGAAFGNDNCIRLSYASSEEQLREACARMKKAFEELS